MARYNKYILLATSCVFLFVSCDDTSKNSPKETEMSSIYLSITDDVFQALLTIKEHRFLFGHHSVGNNILDGLRDLTRDAGVNVQITRLQNNELSNTVNVVDFIPGQNTNPKSKVDGFVEQIGGLDKSSLPDIAALKFCWIDFPPEGETANIMSYYKKNIENLKNEYPEITFAHFTVPLTIRPVNIKAKVKRLLGLQVWGDASNASRAKFNELLFKTFPDEPIFDLAKIESTRLNGTRAEFTYKGTTYSCLAPEYTNDSGHLNKTGQRVVASKLVLFLANIINSANKKT